MHQTLRDLSVRPSYRKGKDDIAGEFYVPCMERAVAYDRAVGFFSSTVFSIAWGALRAFVQRGGKMRVICSPALGTRDIAALEEGHDRDKAHLLKREIESLLADPKLRDPTRVLASLVAVKALEFKIAQVDGDQAAFRRLFHDKVGIFVDDQANAVVFKGSMNETYSGLALGGNLESIDVFCSWLGNDREAARAQDEIDYFDVLWRNQYPGVEVQDFPEVAREVLIDASDPENWQSLINTVCTELEVAEAETKEPPDSRSLREHQHKALEAWERQGRRGILKHATGAGKTFTALHAIREAHTRQAAVLVVAPSRLLVRQWMEEIGTILPEVSVLRCGDGHTRWRADDRLFHFTSPSGDPRLVLATMHTASSEEFLEGLNEGEHLLLVVDEVHRIGAPGARRLLNLITGPRLGLSATPERAGDPAGTERIFSYFNGIVPPPYGLQDAIRDRVLTPYAYRPQAVVLSETEQEAWDGFTAKIVALRARIEGGGATDELEDRLRLLVIQRSRVAKKAEQKIPLSVELVTRDFRRDQKWLVYCDDQDQMYSVLDALRASGVPALDYHSKMSGDPRETLTAFDLNGGVIVSIRCLDEGVDIPSATHALILASSRNPREFIQRRGRVLRRSENKDLATIYDALVVPRAPDPKSPDLYLQAELIRALEFARGSLGRTGLTDLALLAQRFGIPRSWVEEEEASMEAQDLAEMGVEDDAKET